MTDRPRQPDPQPDPSDSESPQSRMDRLCDEFERRLKSGERPAIEDFLQKVPPGERAALFPHLLGLEFDYREHAGEELSAADYFARHPEYRAEIEQLFRQFGPHHHPPQRPQDRPAARPSADAQDSARSSTELASGPRQMGKYLLVQTCGRGGMGIVYKARHPLLRRPRAVKVLRDHYDPEAAERFRLELENAEVLVHPNIVLVHDAGEDAGRLFMVMEYVDGLDLQRIVKERGPLPFGAACEVIRQAALGLQHADEHFLVHRDIKPSNLMLDASGRVKILDFGLARFRAERDDASSRLTTRDGALLGTVDFMAPEQWKSAASVTIHADLYSLGCTLYYLLTGEVPYPKKTRTESVLDTLVFKQRAHQEAPIPRLADYCRECPPELQDVLDRLMAKRPEDRPAGPAEVVRLMEPLADLAALRPLIPAPSLGDSQHTPRSGLPAGPHAIPNQGGAVDPSSVDTNSHGATAVLPKPQPSRTINPRWPDRRAMIVTALLSVAVALGVLLWRPWRTDPVPSPVDNPRAAADLAVEVASLPGLNGGWWFDETPWLTPSVRAELSRRIRAGEVNARELHDAIDTTEFADSHAPLKAMVEQVAAQQTSVYPLNVSGLLAFSEHRRTLSVKDMAEELASMIPAKVRREVEMQKPLPEEEFANWSAEGLHLLAVVLHALSRTDNSFAAPAEWAYRRALNVYEHEQSAAGLEALFYADLARFRADQQQHSSARVAFQDAARLPAGDLFALSLAAQTADFVRQWRSGNREFLAEAEDALEAAARTAEEIGLPERHPLRLELLERHAWLDLDRWKLDEAQQRFARAGDARWQQLEAGNPLAYEPWAFDRQGEAMALHFLGRDEVHDASSGAGAVDLYRELISDFEKYISVQSDAPDGRKRERLDRLPNLYERLADCYLFGPDPDYARAAQELGEAVRHAREARFDYSSTRWFHLVRLYDKRAIALLRGAATGETAADGPQADKLLAEAEAIKERFGAAAGKVDSAAPGATQPAAAAGARYYEYEERVARALQGDEAARAGKLRTLLVGLNDEDVDRRTLEIVLLAFQVYLQSDPARGSDLEGTILQLITLTDDVQRADEAMRQAFLLPIFELAKERLTPGAAGTTSAFTDELLAQLTTLIERLRPDAPDTK